MYHGDIRLGDTLDVKFTTRSFTTGAPTTLAGTPSIAAYVGNGTTEITAGITLTVDFDARTGLHNVRVVATSGNGYATATNVQLVITAGTVGGVSVVGEVIGSFSIEARSAVMPTVAARTLDVSATGEAGIDWANIGSPTTAVNLSATNIDVDQVVASVSGAVGSVTGAVGSVTGNVGGNVVGSVASVTAGVTVTTNNDKTGYRLSATGVDDIWDEATSGHTTAGTTGKALTDAGSAGDPWSTALPGAYGAGTAGKIIGDNIDAAISSRLATSGYTAPLSAAGTRTALGMASANLDTQLAAIPTGTENADALLGRNVAGGADGTRTVSQALYVLRNKTAISGGTLTVYQTDDATPSFTATVGTTAGDPISSIDPA